MNLNPFRKAAPADTDPSTPPAPAGAKTDAKPDAKPDPRPEAPAQPASPPPKTPLSGMTDQMRAQQAGAAPSATDALNSQIVQAVQFSNQETAAYAASQVAVPPNMMITQASGLVAQAAANYFDGASKLAMASKSVLLKDMTEKFAKEDLKGAAEDALGILITDLLVGTAAAVAAAAGAIEGEAAHFALDKIDQSLSKYQDLLDKRGA